MKRIFISMPMAGKSQLGIESERNRIIEWCQREWIGEDLVFAPLMSEFEAKANPPVRCLGWSIQQLGMADIVIFSPDWEKTRGCKVEHLICELYDRPYIDLGHTDNPDMVYAVRSRSAGSEE